MRRLFGRGGPGPAGAPEGVVLADLVGADGGFLGLGVEFLLEGGVGIEGREGRGGAGISRLGIAEGAGVGVPDEGLEEGGGDGAAGEGN